MSEKKYKGSKFFIPSKWLTDEHWSGNLSELAALMYIIGTANYKDKVFTRGNVVITVKRGESVISHRGFAKRMGWDKSKTRLFINKYQKLDYIKTEVRQGILVVSVCYYDQISRLPDTRTDKVADKNKTKIRQDADKNETYPSKYSKNSENSNINRTALFDEFWELYPRKRRGNKQKAKSAYEKALKEERATEEEILQGTKNYVDSNPGDYAKGCQAWLNNDGWSHQYSPSRVTTRSENYTPVKSIYEKPNVCPNLEELFTEINNTYFRQRGLQLGIEHLQSKENRTEEEERKLNEQIATRARDQKRLQELQNDLSKLQRR